MGATVAKRRGFPFPNSGSGSSGTRDGRGDVGTEKSKVKRFFEKHTIYVVVCLMVLVWTLKARLRQHVLDRESVEPNKVLSIKTRCQDLRGGLGPDNSGGCKKQITRLLDYCNEEIPRIDGDENGFYSNHGDEDFELVHILLTVRHGDRSAIHSIPHALGSDEAEARGARPLEPWQYSKKGLNHPVHGNEFLDLRALNYLPSLKKFDLRAIEGEDISSKLIATTNSKLNQENSQHEKYEHQELPPVRPLPDALAANSLFQTPDFDLPPGQLTSRGFMQEFHLGSYLKSKYGNFLEGRVTHPVHAYVRTTNYPRTIQSVAALILGLLPDIGGPDHPITLLSHILESSEVMHGVGLRLSSREITAKSQSQGDKEIIGGCPRSASLAKKQKTSYNLQNRVYNRIETLFGDKASSRFITDIADASLPPICHNLPLPCSMEDRKGCLTESDVGEIMSEADRAFCARYTGNNGGDVATKLSIYPFLREIVTTLKEAAYMDARWSAMDAEVLKRRKDAEAQNKEYIPTEHNDTLLIERPDPLNPTNMIKIDVRRDERKSLHIYMGHDTVIAPVLAGLGLYKGDLCRWPPYASRISFELLKSLRDKNTVRSIGSTIYYYVRIIYNGKDLTPQVEKCSGSNPCPLEKIEETVADLIRPHLSLEDACNE